MTEQQWQPTDDLPADLDPEWAFDGPVEELFEGTVPPIGSQPADCCSARPAFRAVLPPTESRIEPMTLLFCGHHYRLAQDGLTHAGASVYDSAGRLVLVGRTVVGACVYGGC